MKNKNLYSLVGLTWLISGLYQLKNDNMFMFGISAVISAALFLLDAYNKFRKNKN